jgi:hypothetical protein
MGPVNDLTFLSHCTRRSACTVASAYAVASNCSAYIVLHLQASYALDPLLRWNLSCCPEHSATLWNWMERRLQRRECVLLSDVL